MGCQYFTVCDLPNQQISSRFSVNFWQEYLTAAMSKIKLSAGGRYRERQRAAPGASILNRPVPRRHSIMVTAAQCMHRRVSFSIAEDGLIVDRTDIQAAQTEWLGAWVRCDEWAFAPLAAARGTSTLPTGGLCACLRRANLSMNGWLDK